MMMLYSVTDVVEKHCNLQAPQIEDCVGGLEESCSNF